MAQRETTWLPLWQPDDVLGTARPRLGTQGAAGPTLLSYSHEQRGEKLYEVALTLPDDDRADLAALLLGSLNAKPETQVESTRPDEVAKRRDLARHGRIVSELTAEAQEMGLFD